MPRRSHSRIGHAVGALVAFALLTSPSRAEAQLGGLMKKAAKAAAAKVVEKKDPAPADDQTVQPPSDASDPRAAVRPTKSDLLPLTGELLDRFFQGYAEEHALMRQLRSCMQAFAESARMKALQEEQVSPATKPARKDEITRLLNEEAGKACGQYATVEHAGDEWDVHLMLTGAKAAGLTPRQYAMVRERVMGFAGQASKEDRRNYAGYRFDGAERAALEARREKANQLLKDYRGDIE